MVSNVKLGVSRTEGVRTIMNGYLVNLEADEAVSFQRQVDRRQKSELTGALLGMLFGGIGAHRFYRDQVEIGILYVGISGVISVMLLLATPFTALIWALGLVPWAGWLFAAGAVVGGDIGFILWLFWIAWGVYLLADAAMTPDAIKQDNAKIASRAYEIRRPKTT